jgi:catecholate siderophore receptor
MIRAFVVIALMLAISEAPAVAQPMDPGGLHSASAAARAYVDPRPSPASMDTTTRFPVRIPSLPLAEALRELTLQTGLNAAIVESGVDVRSTEVEGNLTSAEALRMLLRGTGLAAHFGRVDGIAAVGRSAGRTGVQELAAVVIRADAGRRYVSRQITSATRTATPLRDTPQSVTVVSADLAADQGMQSLADVVRYIPGVTMGQGEGHRDAPTIRGNASTSDFFLDGVRDDAQYLRDLYNVERIEAIKGPNAMIFGRGGGGGVLNRVRKQAAWSETRELALTAGVHGERRLTADFGGPFATPAAVRMTGMLEDSDRFRDDTGFRRYGVNPTLSLLAGSTLLQLGAERFVDERTVDRGIPSFRGRPAETPVSTFFGDPDRSHSRASVNSGALGLQRTTASGLSIANRTHATGYDKYYQNVYPGAVDQPGERVSLSAYSAAARRTNVFNQTDVTHTLTTGPFQHRLLAGAEFGRQQSSNFRATGYFDGDVTTISAPLSQPMVSVPVTFRQSPTDADSRTDVGIASVYLQDQIGLTRHLHAVLGARVESFGLRFRDLRGDRELSRADRMVSPRAALLVKPHEMLSLYGSYSVSYLPGSGEQFASLTATTQSLEPERFINHEAGVKWDVGDLSLSAAAYRLDRSNTSAPDPEDARNMVQTGRQRTTGFELGATGSVTGRWQVAWGYNNQIARVVSRTVAAAEGAMVPLVPRSTLSIWNRYELTRHVAVGAGLVHQGASFAAIDNSVELPAFTRIDGGLFVSLGEKHSIQLNVENLRDTRYYPTSHGNNNIMPGSPRTLRVSAVSRLR